MKKPLVIANWKSYLTSPEEVKRFASVFTRRAKRFADLDLAIAPPTILLPTTAAAFAKINIRIAAQTVSPYTDEKHTGEVSAAMLKASGVSMTLVGHSERRQPPMGAGESDEVVCAQVVAAAAVGLVVVLCVGERERDPAGAHFSSIATQLTSALEKVAVPVAKLVIAYEPVWAIGKSAKDAMQPAELQEMVIFIRKTLADILGRTAGVRVPILYGGSVEAENAKALLSAGGVAGFLVGHASTTVEPFIDLLAALH